jgi:hypothetical protein
LTSLLFGNGTVDGASYSLRHVSLKMEAETGAALTWNMVIAVVSPSRFTE